MANGTLLQFPMRNPALFSREINNEVLSSGEFSRVLDAAIRALPYVTDPHCRKQLSAHFAISSSPKTAWREVVQTVSYQDESSSQQRKSAPLGGRQMARPFSRMKLGYYPLPIEEARNIRSLLTGAGVFFAIDPCVGDGTALAEMTLGTGADLAGIELDADRAEAASQKGIRTVHGSTFDCRAPAESCSLLYLNPPHDTELGPHSNQRMELVFLEHCFRWVTSQGLIVFVIPMTALGSCARLLAAQFERISLYRLMHPDCVRFRQIAVFGIRKRAHSRGDPSGADGLIRAAYHPNLIPELSQEVTTRYAIPPSGPASINYVGLRLDAIEDALEWSTAIQNARGVLVPKQQKLTGRPVLPLHKGAVGLLACSGMLNGFFGEGEMRHIAYWRSVKHVDEFTEEGEEEGERIIRKRERFSHELTLAYENGNIVELKATKEGGQGG